MIRREFVELYIKYDARKKKIPVPPDLERWNWSTADAIDANLQSNGFKSGIIAGYTSWKPIELGLTELSRCTVVADIFPGLPRTLGELCGYAEFEAWKPDREVEWFEPIGRGDEYPRDWPLILRPAVSSERPAIWYLEDGSGRGVCFFRHLLRSGKKSKHAFGYLGIDPDPGSSFMRREFPSLLTVSDG